MEQKQKGLILRAGSDAVKLALDSGILPKWHTYDWDDYDNDPAAKSRVRKYVTDPANVLKDGLGVYLYGDNGTGKTLLMNLAFSTFMLLGYRVRIITLGTLVTKFTNGWYDKDAAAEFRHLVTRPHFLGIEEIGKEYRSDTSSLASNVLDSVLRVRVQNKLPLWATSNIDATKIKSTYTPDIASMFREACIPIHVSGKDYRVTIAERNEKRYL